MQFKFIQIVVSVITLLFVSAAPASAETVREIRIDGHGYLPAGPAPAAGKDPHKLHVVYDARYGFPRRIDYDGNEMIADDELQCRLTDFHPGGPD